MKLIFVVDNIRNTHFLNVISGNNQHGMTLFDRVAEVSFERQ